MKISELIRRLSVSFRQNVLGECLDGHHCPAAGGVETVPQDIFNNQVELQATVQPLSVATVKIKSVQIENPTGNDVAYVGNASVTVNNGYRLWAGLAVSIDVDGLEKVFVCGTSGDWISYIAVR